MNRSETSQLSELQQQIQNLERQLAESQRLSVLGELVSTTTHEFNNVLMTILNYAKLGLRNRDETSRDKALEKILAAAERAARLTNGILGVARNRADRFEPTDLTQLVDDALLLLEREMSKYRVRIERQLGSVPCVLANGNQIQQILINLLTNARQAMADGGTILVKLQETPGSGFVELSIRDHGTGIPDADLKRIFEPFFTTKAGPDASGKGGTGLGLSACKKIVQAHRGQIRVNSTVGKGTEFIVRLPKCDPPASSVAPIQLSSVPLNAGAPTR